MSSSNELWKIELMPQSGSSNRSAFTHCLLKKPNYIQIIPDDISFLAILRRGPTIHLKNKLSLVRCSHIIEVEDNEQKEEPITFYYQFYMSVLEASKIEMRNENFLEDGIMGKWKFVFDSKNKIPKIKLLQTYTSIFDFFKEACDKENPEWIRKTFKKYADLVDSKNVDAKNLSVAL